MGIFALTVVGSIVAILIVAACVKYWGAISIKLRNCRYKKKFFNRLIESGVTNFYFSRSDFTKYRDGATLEAYLQNAKRSVKIIALWMAESIEMEGIIEGLKKILNRDDFTLMKIAIINPDSEIVRPLAKLLDMEEKEVFSKISNSIKNLSNLMAQLNASDKQKFQLKVYDVLPVASVIMIDDGEENGRIQFDFKIYHAPRANSFGFELTNTKSTFYKLCKSKYNLLLDESSEFKLEDIEEVKG